MSDCFDYSSFDLAFSLDRKRHSRCIITNHGTFKRILQTLPQRFGQQCSLFDWEAQRFGNNLINAHAGTVAGMAREENLDLLPTPRGSERRSEPLRRSSSDLDRP